ncbi:hypothetical protein C2G38_2204344 [Gigaspora rosea]|uniref:Uncharacterized protein n=1 Tax=Gigaspora rosea TaxID=44941 RepID=A0A397UQP2_9GLOM|nr:hypothetical protein C2G38_2204344 [Gigaspora rosea]
MSKPRPIYITPKPTYYNYEEGYIVETSIKPHRHSYLLNRRRNPLVRPSWKKNNSHKIYSIREEIRHEVSKYSKVEEIYNKYATLAKTLTNEQAAKFQQLVHEVVGGDYINDVQFYEDLKIVLEILEDLIDRERIVKNSESSKGVTRFRDKEEPEYLSLYIQINASVKKDCSPQVSNCYRNDTGISKNKTSGIEDEIKAYPYYQQSAKISKQEMDESNKKGDKEITNELTKFEEMFEDKAVEENDEIEEESNKRKNNNKLTKLLNGEALNHACKRWLKQVKDFQLTCKWDKEIKEDKDKVFSLHREFADPGDASGIYQIGHHYENEKADEKDQTPKKYPTPIKDKKESRVGFEDKKCRPLLYAQKPAEISYMSGTNNDGCYEKGIKVEKNEHKAFKDYLKVAGMGHIEGIYYVGYFYCHGIEIINKMLQNLPKDCDIMPEIVRSLKLDENYRVALSRWLKIILTFLVLVMIGTIGPPGIYVGEVGACDTKYMNEISIGADKYDIYLKYYNLAEIYY